MNIINLKKLFFTELKAIYPDTEIQSFFNLLMNFKLNLLRTDIALNPSLKISEEAINYFHSAIGKLKKETPIQYIIGTTEFYGLTFKVNPSVLIPRPETEELIEWIISSTPTNKQLTILDVGTGSGCIAISLAKNLPKAKVYAIDVSSEALKTAKQNAEINNISIKFSEIDILNTTKLPIEFDVIVSNPPYVRELEKKQMQENILANEPHLALFVKDKNPLLFYDKIADLSKNYLSKNGILYFEINQYLGKKTVSLLKSKDFKNIEIKQDIFGADRMLKATMI